MVLVAETTSIRLQTTRTSIEALQAAVKDDLLAVNRVIVDRMQSPVALIPQLAGHIVSSGGKRLRPMLTLFSARLCGYSGARHIPLAACVEFIHTATLLHDDVVDISDLRRGKATANAVWGNEASVLVGDFLFSRAFQIMVEDGNLRVLEILSNASAVIAEGEVKQLVTSNDVATTEQDYLDVITAKTATLFAAATEIAGVVADRPEAECLALASYGLNLGIAFQLIDDMLDYTAAQGSLGKTSGDDFREGKITLPVVLAMARGTIEERAFWSRTLQDEDQRDGDFSHAIAVMRKHGVFDETRKRARAYADAACRALDPFNDGEDKQTLLEMVELSVDRAY